MSETKRLLLVCFYDSSDFDSSGWYTVVVAMLLIILHYVGYSHPLTVLLDLVSLR